MIALPCVCVTNHFPRMIKFAAVSVEAATGLVPPPQGGNHMIQLPSDDQAALLT